MGEIGENSTNEANFDEGKSILEVLDPIKDTANSDAFWGLDNGSGRALETHARTGN
jgi:hypothetical protein